jgi:DNA mismatch repair protein MutL
MASIRRLPSNLINQIAAGEVVERPASVVKELVENSIDAGATHIEIMLRDGGRSLITVMDNGRGIPAQEMALALERHATSKLPDEDLFNIASLGFRGEALPSIGAVSRLTLTSRAAPSLEGWKLSVEGGILGVLEPTPFPSGTKIEVRDLFFAIPARLKFLKTPATETAHVAEIIQRLAMAYGNITFILKTDQRTFLSLEAVPDTQEGQLKRLSEIMGSDFFENALPVNAERDGFKMTGFISLPTLNRSNAQMQFLFVNGRPVRDKILVGAVRAAYQDFLAHDRHPLLTLFLEVPSRFVDVNVHPAKTEVRFQDSGFVRGFIVSVLKGTLSGMSHRTSTSSAHQAIEAMASISPPQNQRSFSRFSPTPRAVSSSFFVQESGESLVAPSARTLVIEEDVLSENFPMGAACAQLHETYIIAQTRDGLVIVDQHAAHERLVYERLKKDLETTGVKRQLLLIPEIVEVTESELSMLVQHGEDLEKLGLVFDGFGDHALAIREIPALLGHTDIRLLVKDLAEELVEQGVSFKLTEKIHEVCSLMACHGSVRAGKKMSISEMNDLLRQMEGTSYSGQCNHGRPTQVELKLSDIEKLFGRR